MSRLEELIQELCPDGVEYKKIGELMDYEQPSKYIVESTDYSDDYNIPVLTAGQSFILGYTDETDGIYPASDESPVIIFDDFTGAFKWVSFPFKVKSSAMKMLKAKEDVVLFRYAYHLMGWLNYSSTEHKRLWIGIYSEFEVPVPPLEVQREIVRILDKFTELTAKLTAELTARRKQYEYYRDELLTFGDDVPRTPLGNVCSVQAGGTPSKKNSDYWTNGTIKWLGSSVCQNRKRVDEVTDYITEAGMIHSAAKYRRPGTTLIAMVGATIGKVAFLDFEATTNQNVASLFPEDTDVLDVSYLYYVCTGLYDKFQVLLNNGFAMANLNFIRGLEIPVPDIKTQKEIADTLDKFERLCEDISSGLPAEIEARTKQYEFYRDQLLSFKRKEAS